jgi:hypothetical protein
MENISEQYVRLCENRILSFYINLETLINENHSKQHSA